MRAENDTYKVIEKSMTRTYEGFWEANEIKVCFNGSFEECSAWLEDKYIVCRDAPSNRIWVNNYIPEEILSIYVVLANTRQIHKQYILSFDRG